MTRATVGTRTILYVANGAGLGGGGRVLAQAMSGLEPPFVPRLAVPGPGTFSEWAMAHGIPWFVAPSGGSRAVRGRAGTYRNAVELATATWHVAAIHAEAVTCYPPVGLIGGLLRVPRICHVQFPPVPGELEWALRYGAEAVVTVYEHQAREIRAHVPAHIPVIPIPNGIDVEHYAVPDPSPEATAALREGASHTAVLVGHVSEVKGYPTYLRAAKLVLERFPQALFLCAGGETVGVGYTDRMRYLAAELGVSPRVRFLGPLPDVRVALRAADLFVLPSEQEGLPLAALEAMSCGRAVISTPVNGVPEAVQAGVTGLLVPPRDAEELAAAIVTLFTDASRRAEMGRQGVRRVRERFGVQRVQQRLNSLYRELADARAATAGGKTPC